MTFSQGFQFSQDLFPPSSSTELMVVMKHLLHQQHAGRPGSPPGWKCHDRFPLVITVVFLQRLEGKQSHLATIRQPKLGLLAQSSPPLGMPQDQQCPRATPAPTAETPGAFRNLLKSLIALPRKAPAWLSGPGSRSG